jgi:hypothetical protein
MSAAPEFKEVQMDAPLEEGGRTSRRRRNPRRGRKTRSAPEEDATVVTKAEAPVVAAVVASAAPIKPHTAVAKPTAVVLAPPKKKPAKVLLVPKGKVATPRPLGHKTFRAKRIRVMIDNTDKTRKHRSSVMEQVDSLTDDQVRAAAVHARLSRRETVGNAPIQLLRQMVKDYQIMKRQLQ